MELWLFLKVSCFLFCFDLLQIHTEIFTAEFAVAKSDIGHIRE